MAWDDLGSCDIRNYFWHDAYEYRAVCLCRIFGCLLALCVERTKHLYGAILAHMAANTISVIRTETNWLSWMDESLRARALTTVGMGLVFIGLYLLVFWKGKGTERK